MNHRKIILITGATGAKGGSVARALLAENKFAVRILCRNAAAEKALALQSAGAVIAEGDMDDMESLKLAMTDCYGVFGITHLQDDYNKAYQQGKNLVDAVHASGIQHFVFDTLRDYYTLSGGRYAVPHCDLKARLEQYTRSLSVPASFVRVAFYYENFLTCFPLQKTGENSFSFGFPQGDTPLAMISVEDLGAVVAGIFNHPAVYIKRVTGAVGADEPCSEYAAIMSKVLGKDIRYNYIPRDKYASMDFPNAEALANMFEVQRLHISNRRIDLVETYALNPATQSFTQWVIANKEKFETALAAQKALVV